MLLKLKCSCIELVEVMVEETSKHSPQLGKWVFSHLTLRNFLFAMKEIWDEYTSLRRITNKDYLQKSVFRAYHVLRRIADYKNVTINTLGTYQCMLNPQDFAIHKSDGLSRVFLLSAFPIKKKYNH